MNDLRTGEAWEDDNRGWHHLAFGDDGLWHHTTVTPTGIEEYAYRDGRVIVEPKRTVG